MEIDSTPLDVLVLLDDGVPGRVMLTGLIDVATRTVPAAGDQPDGEVRRRERSPGPGAHARAGEAGMAGQPCDGALGFAL